MGTYTCTITNDDVAPTLNVIKHVVNDNGGTATASAWTLAVSSSNGGSGTGSAAGAESPGTPYTLQAGKAYSVAESGGPSGYAASSSAGCSIASATVGGTYTCTITNDDVAPTLTVIKHVINNNGGSAGCRRLDPGGELVQRRHRDRQRGRRRVARHHLHPPGRQGLQRRRVGWPQWLLGQLQRGLHDRQRGARGQLHLHDHQR